jgi:hypothetical protein
MGMWGIEPWDNDGAADWFGDFMDATKIREHWIKTITLDDEDSFEEIRAAIWIFIQLGRVYVWPIDELESDLVLAINACNVVLGNEDLVEEVPDLIERVKSEKLELESRRRPVD